MRPRDSRSPLELELAHDLRAARLQRDVLDQKVRDLRLLVQALQAERADCTCWRDRRKWRTG